MSTLKAMWKEVNKKNWNESLVVKAAIMSQSIIVYPLGFILIKLIGFSKGQNIPASEINKILIGSSE